MLRSLSLEKSRAVSTCVCCSSSRSTTYVSRNYWRPPATSAYNSNNSRLSTSGARNNQRINTANVTAIKAKTDNVANINKRRANTESSKNTNSHVNAIGYDVKFLQM